MSHHLVPFRANRVQNPSAFFTVGDLELLLNKNGGLLVRALYDTINEMIVGGRGRRV